MLFGHEAKSALSDVAPTKGPKHSMAAADVLAKYDADQPQTGLADAIHALLQRKGGDLPAAIVVMSDGRDNASKYSLDEVAQECATLKVPLHIYGTGAGEAASLKLRDLFVQETLFAEDNVTIPVRWRGDGIEKGTAVITVTLAGKEQRKEVAVQKGTDQVTEFTFTVPKTKDKLSRTDIGAIVALREDDTLKDEQHRPVQIIDGKVKVLYVEYAPRKEYHFLQTAMLRDRRIEPRFWLITADPKALSGGPFERDFPAKKDLAQYDVVVLGDVPADILKKQNRQDLAEFVSKNRGGLVVMAGRQFMPASYASAVDFAAMLPVEFQAHKFAVDSPGNPLAFRPQLTPAGLRTDWLALSDLPEDNNKQWRDLPGLFWYYPLTKLRAVRDPPSGASHRENGRRADAAGGHALLRQRPGPFRRVRGNLALAAQYPGQNLRPLLGSTPFADGPAAQAWSQRRPGPIGGEPVRVGSRQTGNALRSAFSTAPSSRSGIRKSKARSSISTPKPARSEASSWSWSRCPSARKKANTGQSCPTTCRAAGK